MIEDFIKIVPWQGFLTLRKDHAVQMLDTVTTQKEYLVNKLHNATGGSISDTSQGWKTIRKMNSLLLYQLWNFEDNLL